MSHFARLRSFPHQPRSCQTSSNSLRHSTLRVSLLHRIFYTSCSLYLIEKKDFTERQGEGYLCPAATRIRCYRWPSTPTRKDSSVTQNREIRALLSSALAIAVTVL